MERYYLSDNPSVVPANAGITLMEDVTQLNIVSDSVIYCDSEELLKKIRKLDDAGEIHLGCRGANTSLLCAAKYIRFGSCFLICSKTWDTDKYIYFREFEKPAEELKLPETHYLNINTVSDKEAASIFEKQMSTLSKDEILGIDFETNGFPEDDGFAPLGLSIVDRENAYYYDFDNYPDNVGSRRRFYSALQEYVKQNSHRLYAFNVSFEIRCFYAMYKEFFKLQDTRVWCIIDNVKSNLKYSAQYYLGVGSWDDSVDEEQRALEESFQMPLSDFLYEYKLGDHSTYSCVAKLYSMNRDNPDFIKRYKRYRGNAWACSNQKTVGKYCCYDSVMDIHITNFIREIVHIDHKYNEECYTVYLFNQYLSAMLELSGIYIDNRIADEEEDTLNTIFFNSSLYLNMEFLKYKIDFLQKNSAERIDIELNPYISYLVDELGNYLFINEPVKLAKEFVNLVRNNEEAYAKLIGNKYDEFSYIVTAWKDDETWKAASRGRKLLSEIGNALIEEWDLKSFFTEFNTKYLEKSQHNKKIAKYFSGSEDELRDLLRAGKKVWKDKIPANFHEKISTYILDLDKVYTPDAITGSLELRRCQSLYNKVVNALKGRTLYTPIDESLNWIMQADLNSPLFKQLFSKYTQSYYQDSYATFSFYSEICAKMNRMNLFTEDAYCKFDEDLHKKFSDFSQISSKGMDFKKYYFENVEGQVTKESVDKRTGKTRTFMVGTGVMYKVPIVWNLAPKPMEEIPPFFLPKESHTNPWKSPDEIDNIYLDEEFRCRIFNLHKFLGYYKLNRVVCKILSTSIMSIRRDSRNVHLMDGSRCQRVQQENYVRDKLTKYFTRTAANTAVSGRWDSNCHSLFSGSEETRVVLQTKIGTHFLLPHAANDSLIDDTVYVLDGYNFRSSDFVRLSTGEYKRVSELSEQDSFDKEWLESAIIMDRARTGDIYWDWSELNEV